ncbi:MAG: hypothetical protein RMJ43_13460 [Chloroherpetonaceae bacterium]|nr:hypothetical protein [Chthonomonadaceae bacterium]MDW8208836.1 hypothetical protein [Chloroherpetonaceae bacterium]
MSARYDLGFFICSGVLTFVFYGVYRLAHHMGFLLHGDSILITYFFFTAFFDHPHIFQTFSRTHYDGAEFARRPGLYTWGLGAFLAAGLVITALGWEARLIVFAAIYGTWHIIRQHAGFLKIYKRLNDDTDPLDDWIDFATFYTGMFACLLNDYADIRGPVVIYRDLQATFPSLPADIGEVGWGAFLVLLMVFGARQVWRVMQGRSINVPKVLLMAAALSTHYFVFFATATPFLVAEALETAYHDVQYQGWMWHYQRRRFPGVRHVALKWLAVGMLYGLVVGVIETYGLMQRGWAMWLFVPFTMVVLFHYYVDGLIWRFRECPELRPLIARADTNAGTTG